MFTVNCRHTTFEVTQHAYQKDSVGVVETQRSFFKGALAHTNITFLTVNCTLLLSGLVTG
jgi:hypothetical protein